MARRYGKQHIRGCRCRNSSTSSTRSNTSTPRHLRSTDCAAFSHRPALQVVLGRRTQTPAKEYFVRNYQEETAHRINRASISHCAPWLFRTCLSRNAALRGPGTKMFRTGRGESTEESTGANAITRAIVALRWNRKISRASPAIPMTSPLIALAEGQSLQRGCR